MASLPIVRAIGCGIPASGWLHMAATSNRLIAKIMVPLVCLFVKSAIERDVGTLHHA